MTMDSEKERTDGKSSAKHCGFSIILNHYFHHIDRGGTLKSEILSGILIFIISACGIFINMQLLAKMSISGDYANANTFQIAANGETYASLYFMSMLFAFVGSLLIGVLARLPIVQVSSLGLSVVFISMVGVQKGLTYSNLLVISFISSILYVLLVLIPGVRKQVFQAIPASVRKALPAAAGLFLVFISMQLTGIITVKGSSISVYGIGSVLSSVNHHVSLSGMVNAGSLSYSTDKFHPLLLIGFLVIILTFILYLLFKRYSKRPYFLTLLSGTGIFILLYLCCVIIDWKNQRISIDSLWGRIWMIGGEDAMQTHLRRIISDFSIGKVLKEGLDFSAYTSKGGNVILLFITGILTFLFMCMYDAEATLRVTSSSSEAFDADDQKAVQASFICNAGINIAAPLFGLTPIGLGKESYAGTEDGAKSGIAAIVASLGFLLSMFLWIVPTIFATATNYKVVFNMYGHYGTVMQLLTECSFGVADAVVVILGLSMIKHSMDIVWKDYSVYVPFITTIIGTLFLSNIAFGVALGTIVSIIIKLTQGRNLVDGKKSEAIRFSTFIMGICSVLLVVVYAVL